MYIGVWIRHLPNFFFSPFSNLITSKRHIKELKDFQWRNTATIATALVTIATVHHNNVTCFELLNTKSRTSWITVYTQTKIKPLGFCDKYNKRMFCYFWVVQVNLQLEISVFVSTVRTVGSILRLSVGELQRGIKCPESFPQRVMFVILDQLLH